MIMLLAFIATFFLVKAILKYSDAHPDECYSNNDDDYVACTTD